MSLFSEHLRLIDLASKYTSRGPIAPREGQFDDALAQQKSRNLGEPK